jgi:type II secretory pathway predicted ATPase ExeA/outer membrane protein OmpA-like peptidoglycan-associated protein
MYESFFGFKDTPFRLSADEKFRYAHKNYLRASAYLAYALQQSEGFVMITGQPGSGKTTLVRDVISEIDPSKFNAVNLVTSQLHAEELLRKVALEFGLPAESYSKATLLTCINKHLSDLYDHGQRSILFLDEAQNLSLNGLEELRLLSNLQKGNRSLLQIVLIGHDELRDLVLGPNMEHIQQRLIATCQIKPMSVEQTQEYITHRLSVVGWRDDPAFENGVFKLVHQAAQGVPRKINHLMNRLLLFASLEEKHQLIDEDALVIIEELIDENRISLANNETFSSFAQRYKSEKQQSEDEQVVFQKAAVHDIFENKPLQEQFFNDTELEKRREMIDNTNQITENLLAAIEAHAEEIEEAWDLPDTDWGSWESEITIKKELQSVQRDEVDFPEEESPVARKKPKKQLESEAKEREVSLPSADDIWNSEMDSVVMESVVSNSKKKKKKSTLRDYQKKANQQTTSLEDRRGWGGVWFMSSEERSDDEGQNENNDQTAKSEWVGNAKRTANRISVDENLSMPSVWVDGCPEAIVSDTDQPFSQKSRANKWVSSIFRMVSWIGIGLLTMFFYYLFSEQINSFATQFVQHVNGVGESNPQMLESAEVETEPVVALEAGNGAASQSVPNESGSQEIVEGSNFDASVLEVKDGEFSENKNIELATRYAVFFDFNKASIPTQYVPLLKSVQYMMQTEEDTFLRIIGYADTQGDSNYNYRLSLKRADEVKQFFTQRGIAGDRLNVAAVGAIEDGLQTTLRRSESAKRRRVELILFPN